MRIGIDGPVSFLCLDGEFPTSSVVFEVTTNNEERAKVVSLETVRECGLIALQKLAYGKTFRRFKQTLEEGGAVILPGSPPFFLLKDSVRIR